MTTKLDVCREARNETPGVGDGCHRGIERGIKQDADGHDHGAVRVACAKCGVATDWMIDDSLQRAVVGWNQNGVPLAEQTLAKTRAEEAAALKVAQDQAAAEAAKADKAASKAGKAG